MAENKKIDFCTNCRKDTEFTLQKRNIIKSIKGTEYTFNITVAICNECGEEVSVPGIIDLNVQEVDNQYRKYTGIVSPSDIEKLMRLYHIGKAPLSLALGFGEVTITRYLSGQIPSKEYSDIIKQALASPRFMIEKLNENKNTIAKTAYNKSMDVAIELQSLFSVSNMMLRVIAYIFESLKEVTPLMLQKLLYFTQGVSYALNQKPMFEENCQAWIHGPVYPKVYNIFKDFKYNPIEDERFAIVLGSDIHLSDEEERILNLVINTFGDYSGKTLEKITHKEAPWQIARSGYEDDIPSNNPITKDNIEAYFCKKHKEYNFQTEEGLNKYIKDMI